VPVASIRRVSHGYFDAVGTRLLEGRDFTPDDRDGSERVAIIDETVARRYWPGGSALGRRITTGGAERPVWRTVVGVTSTVRHENLARAPDHYVYYPLAQDYGWTLDLVIRTAVSPTSLIQPVRAEISAIDPDLPFYQVHTLEEALDQSLATRRFTNQLLLGFAGSALLLAAIGIYGVMARTVTARVREFGVRLALGADPRRIQSLVLRQAARLVLIGTLGGIAGALGATRLLRSQLFGVNPIDPVSFAAAAMLLAGMVMLASWLPARRATRTDPLEALRSE
jgi:predicted permease